MSAAELNGILVVDKPTGLTSADVVARVKRGLRAARVGHTGTLDPMATGVLPIVIGEGTKVAPFLLADDKEYEGELELGYVTNTLDAEGEIVSTARELAAQVDQAALLAACAEQVGELQQIPPMYSAIRKDGQRMYELARRGVEVEIEARPVRVDSLTLLSFHEGRARFRVACSKGTYVRSIVRDIGARLGCGATLTALRRIRAGRFTIDQAATLDGLTPELAAARLISPGEAVLHLLAVPLLLEQLILVKHGKPLPAPADAPEGTTTRLMSPSGALAALGEVMEGKIRYLRVLNCGLTPEAH